MPLPNLPPEILYKFIEGDFEDAWGALVAAPSRPHRGNFVFARQTMVLLEFAARLCKGDASGQALRDLSVELGKIDPKYFTPLPGRASE